MLLARHSAETIDLLARAGSDADVVAAVRRFADAQDLAHFAYLAVPVHPAAEPRVLTTYSRAWQEEYASNGFVDVDPVVGAGLTRTTPFDWADLPRSGGIVGAFFEAAAAHGVGREGLTVPIRPAKRPTLFSVSTDAPPELWRTQRDGVLAACILIAYAVDAFTDRADAARGPALTARERDCLAWTAAGKSLWDISVILGIGERTVRFHLRNARTKLGATSTIHAVALAIRRGLVDLP